MADDPVGDGGKLMSAHGLDLTSGAVIRCGRNRFFVFFLFPVFKSYDQIWRNVTTVSLFLCNSETGGHCEFIEVNGRAF